MINILICDDEINDANIVKACIENLLDSKNIAYNIEVCLNATELIEKSKNVNFLFLDMEINGISGILWMRRFLEPRFILMISIIWNIVENIPTYICITGRLKPLIR